MGARVAGADREVAEADAQRKRTQAQHELCAPRALEVGVDDDERRAGRPAHVVAGRDGRRRRGAQVAHGGGQPAAAGDASASKMRLAPGRSPGESATWLQRTVPSGSTITSARCGKPPGW